MLTLINTNRMRPPVAPIGLDYIAAAAGRAGIPVALVDLCLAADPDEALRAHFAAGRARLVGLSFRNVDDCFWPSARSFVAPLRQTVARLRELTDAPVVLGGVGYSIFPQRLLEETGADFGIHGDGEGALVALYRQLTGRGRLEEVPGLLWRAGGRIVRNAPAWPARPETPSARDAVDNAAYFRLGGQGGIETKRGCDRQCVYCADRLAKGPALRLRDPAVVAEEAAALLAGGVDVLHLCDAEFNIPRDHALAVCDALIRRGLHRRLRWYAYLAVVPFDAALADAMRRAGCAGVNFTTDAACEAMLATYRQPHRKQDIARAVRLCRRHGLAVMLDLLLGGPGETPQTLAESIAFFRHIRPDCVGAALGLRIYPGLEAERLIAAEGPLETNPAVRRRYPGPIDLLKPTFYVSAALGERPAALVRELIAGDRRFFAPQDEPPDDADAPDAAAGARDDHNYNANARLAAAIAAGARGAWWDILRRAPGR